ncbi:hypothetical protein B4Q13_25480, partial [Lacticaseibacillus rhamnosus]
MPAGGSAGLALARPAEGPTIAQPTAASAPALLDSAGGRPSSLTLSLVSFLRNAESRGSGD